MEERKDKQINQMMKIQIFANVLIIALACSGLFYINRRFNDQSVIMIGGLFLLICMIVSSGISIYMNNKTLKEIKKDTESRTSILLRASRDMRVPMNTIINFSEKDLVSNYNPLQMIDALEKVNNSGTYMMMLIEDLLALYRFKDSNLEIKEQAYTIAECIDSVTEMMKLSFENKNIHFNQVYKNVDKFKYVMVDKIRVQQIIINLLSNAKRYTKENGKVILLVEGHDKEDSIDIAIHVKDNGLGMSKEKIEEVLSHHNISNEGIGMGMSIVNTLVEALHGKITCESKEDVGTEFIVTFNWPYYKDQSEEVIAIDYSVLEGKHVLLVENNMMNAEIADNILSHKGISTDLAKNGREGFEMFMHAMPHTYDAILMDLRMPVMDGVEATKKIRHSTHPEANIIPIIAMTADVLEEDHQKTKEAGMNAHINKPIVPSDLYVTLSNHIR